MRLVLFDADGTLIDSQAVIHESMRIAFVRFGYPEPPIDATRSIIGLTLDRAIATMLGREIDEEVLAIAAEYKEIYVSIASRPEMVCRAYDGIPQIVQQLSRCDDVVLGVVTGKSRRGVQRLFESHGFANCFTVSRCADDCPSKPHPAMVLECCRDTGIGPASTMVIGDTAFDMEMAAAAGAYGVGVTWGYHPVERMLRSGARTIVNTTADLEGTIFRWLGMRHGRDEAGFRASVVPSMAFSRPHA